MVVVEGATVVVVVESTAVVMVERAPRRGV